MIFNNKYEVQKNDMALNELRAFKPTCSCYF